MPLKRHIITTYRRVLSDLSFFHFSLTRPGQIPYTRCDQSYSPFSNFFQHCSKSFFHFGCRNNRYNGAAVINTPSFKSGLYGNPTALNISLFNSFNSRRKFISLSISRLCTNCTLSLISACFPAILRSRFFIFHRSEISPANKLPYQ
jgi:hypothetical protein